MERAPGDPIVKLARSQPVVTTGTMIADKYRVEKELGRGGFGVVVRARHVAIDQVVAIKILTQGDGGDAEWREDAARFRREAQATAALRGEHVVRILDVDTLADGAPYMVMEYLEGETLHHAIHTRTLSTEEVVDHVVQVLAALAEAHAAGIVHRDLKPANVLITRGAGGTLVAKVLDFGVSKLGAHSGVGTSSAVAQPLTRTGALIGTVAYMAPEQMVDAKRVDARADLWSVGILLFEMLTKQTPFGPPSAPTIVSSMLTKPPASLVALRPDVPPRLEKVVMRCLAKRPEQRYANAAAVGAALAKLTSPRARGALDTLRRAGKPAGAAAPLDEAGSPGVRRAPVPVPHKADRRTLRAAMLLGALVTVAVLGIALGLLLGQREHAQSPRALPGADEVADPGADPTPAGR